jgi:hypothetical protein
MHMLLKIIQLERGWLGRIIWSRLYPERAAYDAAGQSSYTLEETWDVGTPAPRE